MLTGDQMTPLHNAQEQANNHKEKGSSWHFYASLLYWSTQGNTGGAIAPKKAEYANWKARSSSGRNSWAQISEGMDEERGTNDSGNGNDTKEERKTSNFLPQPQVGAKLLVTTHPQNLLNRCPLRDLQAGCPINKVEPHSSLKFHHVPFIYVWMHIYFLSCTELNATDKFADSSSVIFQKRADQGRISY